jgi:hypothetical protein
MMDAGKECATRFLNGKETNLMNATSTALDQWVQPFEEKKRSAPGLAGIDGRLLLELEGSPVATLQVANGNAELTRQTQSEPIPDATVDFSDPEALVGVLSCELNAVVAALQGRMYITGNQSFAAKTLLGLPIDKPFAMPETAKEDDHAD